MCLFIRLYAEQVINKLISEYQCIIVLCFTNSLHSSSTLRFWKKAECEKTDAFELWCWRTFESPLDCKEIQPVNPKGNQSWIVIRRTDAEAETLILFGHLMQRTDSFENMVWGGRREEGSGWGTHVYLWWIHFDIWQN